MRWNTVNSLDFHSEKLKYRVFRHFSPLIFYENSSAGFKSRCALQNFVYHLSAQLNKELTHNIGANVSERPRNSTDVGHRDGLEKLIFLLG
jgi:hypothetical protein